MGLLGRGNRHCISSARVSGRVGVSTSRVTGSLSCIGVSNHAQIKCRISTLVTILRSFLNFAGVRGTFLFNMKDLKKTLLHSSKLDRFNLRVMTTFSMGPSLMNAALGKVPVFRSSSFRGGVRRCNIRVNMLAIPVRVTRYVASAVITNNVGTI